MHFDRLQCRLSIDEVKEKAEKYLDAFIRNHENSEGLNLILKNCNNPMPLFITVELLTKNYLVDSGIGIIECRLWITRLQFKEPNRRSLQRR